MRPGQLHPGAGRADRAHRLGDPQRLGRPAGAGEQARPAGVDGGDGVGIGEPGPRRLVGGERAVEIPVAVEAGVGQPLGDVGPPGVAERLVVPHRRHDPSRRPPARPVIECASTSTSARSMGGGTRRRPRRRGGWRGRGRERRGPGGRRRSSRSPGTSPPEATRQRATGSTSSRRRAPCASTMSASSLWMRRSRSGGRPGPQRPRRRRGG